MVRLCEEGGSVGWGQLPLPFSLATDLQVGYAGSDAPYLVEPQVQRLQASEFVHYRRNLSKLIVPEIKHLKRSEAA